MPKSIVYLKRASAELVGNCSCDDGRVTYPPQQDCPWCGCGWLFTCISCRKAFAFAEAVEIQTTWEELAVADWKGWGLQRISKKNIGGWASDMKRLLKGIEPGRVYAYLDGHLFEREARKVKFDGNYASHKFDRLPHVEELRNRAVEQDVLASVEYWRSHKRKRKG